MVGSGDSCFHDFFYYIIKNKKLKVQPLFLLSTKKC